MQNAVLNKATYHPGVAHARLAAGHRSTAAAIGLVLITNAASALLLVRLHGVAVHACPSAVVLALLSAAGL